MDSSRNFVLVHCLLWTKCFGLAFSKMFEMIKWFRCTPHGLGIGWALLVSIICEFYLHGTTYVTGYNVRPIPIYFDIFDWLLWMWKICLYGLLCNDLIRLILTENHGKILSGEFSMPVHLKITKWKVLQAIWDQKRSRIRLKSYKSQACL